MPYSTPSDVRMIIETTLTDDEIAEIIEMSDAEIDRRIGPQDSSDPLIKRLSMLLTALTIKTRQPETRVIGEYRESSGNILEVLRSEIERIFRLYKSVSIKASEYQHIDEESRYKEA